MTPLQLTLDLAVKATLILAAGGFASLLLARASAAARHLAWGLTFVAVALFVPASLVLPRVDVALPDLPFPQGAGTTTPATPVEDSSAAPLPTVGAPAVTPTATAGRGRPPRARPALPQSSSTPPPCSVPPTWPVSSSSSAGWSPVC